MVGPSWEPACPPAALQVGQVVAEKYNFSEGPPGWVGVLGGGSPHHCSCRSLGLRSWFGPQLPRVTSGKSLGHHWPHYFRVYTPCSCPLSHLIVTTTMGVGQSMNSHSHFIEGKLRLSHEPAPGHPERRGPAKPGVCLTPHPRLSPYRCCGSNWVARGLVQEVTDWTVPLWSAT